MSEIVERLLALGWEYDERGVLRQPKGFKGCKVSADEDFMGTRYKVQTRGESIYGSGTAPAGEKTAETGRDITAA